jgi:TetR/AcrR family transcriptional repressor of nem operon
MPRASRAVARQHHAAIRRASARLLRAHGLGVSVAGVMGAAGLTHGGFYGHFPSKDALLAAGCAAAFAESAARWHTRAGAAADRAAALAAVIHGYLADDGPVESGCPIASLATDVAREASGKPVAQAFCEGFAQLLDILTSLQPPGEAHAVRERALLQMCTMVGALVLARATRAHPLSRELLASARRGVLGPAASRRAGSKAKSRR